VPYVIHAEAVTIIPSPHIELLERVPIIGPKWLVKENVHVFRISGRDAYTNFNSVKRKRLEE
jgi:hypothetical protein